MCAMKSRRDIIHVFFSPDCVVYLFWIWKGKTSSQLNPTDRATSELVQTILREVVDDATGIRLLPEYGGSKHHDGGADAIEIGAAAAGIDDEDVIQNMRLPTLPYLHVGGDEVDLKVYSKQ